MAYTDLKQIGDSTWVIPGQVNIGLYVKAGRAALIDSGNDKEAGRQINKRVEERNWELECIINTHSNADHIGGNAFLQKKTGCRFAATLGEAPFISRPELEAAFLYGGYPYPGLDNKFLRAAPSEVTDIIPKSGPITIGGATTFGGQTPDNKGLRAVPLPGHYFDMIGIRTPDNIVFLADAVFSEQIIKKYHLFYIYDVEAYLTTLNEIGKMEAVMYIPAHAPPTEDITPLLEVNRNKVLEIAGVLTGLCGEDIEGAEFDDILAGVCKHYGIELDASHYVLVSSTLRSFLSYLAVQNEVIPAWTGGRMVWKGITQK